MPDPLERRALLAAVIAWSAVAVLGLALGPPLGHDEAAFAITARGDGPPWLYRSVGVTAIAEIGVALGGAEWQLRLVSALLGTGIVVAAYAVGRAAFSPRTGAWAAMVIAGAHPMALRGPELLGDLPAAACVVAGLAMLVTELSRDDGPRWRVVAAAPAFAAAFYLRYGSAPVIGLAGLAALLVWWRTILRRPLPVVVAAATFALLFVPHLLHARAATGTWLGILKVSAAMPRRAYVGEGLVTYLTANPFAFYGALVAPLMVLGLVGLVRRPVRARPSIFLGLVALGQIVALGIQSHAQPRYVYIATVLLVVLGVEAAQRLAPARLRGAALPLVVTAWIGLAIGAPLRSAYLTRERTPLVMAAAAVRADTGARPCLMVAWVVPQLIWYTRCAGLRVVSIDPLIPWPADRRTYAASLPLGRIAVEDLTAIHPAVVQPMAVAHPRATLWRLDPVTAPAPPP